MPADEHHMHFNSLDIPIAFPNSYARMLYELGLSDAQGRMIHLLPRLMPFRSADWALVPDSAEQIHDAVIGA